MKVSIGLPEGLLQQPREVKQAWFDNHKIEHKKLKEAKARILKTVRVRAGAEVVHVVGPTGVGKTTLMDSVMNELIESSIPEMKNDPGFMPTAFMTCQNPSKGVYDWTEHFIRILVALKEVLIDRKIYLPEAGPMPKEMKKLVSRELGNLRTVRSAAESALFHRKPLAFFTDEAQFILKGSSEEGLENQADTIRSVADESKTLHILLGHYDLIELLNLNGQLGRRSRTVHFTRYYIDDAGDRAEFAKAFMTLQARLPLPEPTQLAKQHVEFAFERSVGCIGRLKNWFSRCLDTAFEHNCKAVTAEIFMAEADDISICRRAAVEIGKGEAKLMEYEDSIAEAELRELLKRKSVLKFVRNSDENSLQEKDHTFSGESQTETKTKGAGGSFEHNTERIPIGVDNVAS